MSRNTHYTRKNNTLFGKLTRSHFWVSVNRFCTTWPWTRSWAICPRFHPNWSHLLPCSFVSAFPTNREHETGKGIKLHLSICITAHRPWTSPIVTDPVYLFSQLLYDFDLNRRSIHKLRWIGTKKGFWFNKYLLTSLSSYLEFTSWAKYLKPHWLRAVSISFH